MAPRSTGVGAGLPDIYARQLADAACDALTLLSSSRQGAVAAREAWLAPSPAATPLSDLGTMQQHAAGLARAAGMQLHHGERPQYTPAQSTVVAHPPGVNTASLQMAQVTLTPRGFLLRALAPREVGSIDVGLSPRQLGSTTGIVVCHPARQPASMLSFIHQPHRQCTRGPALRSRSGRQRHVDRSG